MIVGYARTSTADQKAGLEAQGRDLTAAGVEKVYSEQVSSVAERAHLNAALDFVREGDVFMVTKADRLARSTRNLLDIAESLERKGVALVILSMGGQQIDTRSPTGKLLLTMLGAVAAFERDMMLERQIEGIAAAKAAGKYKGRQPTARKQSAEVLRMLAAPGATRAAVAAALQISERSVYRIQQTGAPA